MDQENRVIVLIDMDCFYCQVEEKLNPELKGKPIAVVQYNPWKGGGIIAVNYVARGMGVTRHMRGDEAKEKCPEIELPSVPCHRGKADITKYRDAGKEVAKVLQKFTQLLERASIDEAYLDITAHVEERLKSLNINTVNTDMMPNTYALGYDCVDEFLADVHSYGMDSIDFDYEHAKRLVVGAVIVSEIRASVYEETGYRCSAGIAHNKILAKLVCGMNKPNKQTVLPKHSVNILYKTLPLKKVKHLGGKFGDTVCEMLKINIMADLQKYSEKELQAKFDEKNGTWLYNISRGIDLEPVQARFNPKSIGCCKQFRGKSALLDLDSLRKWLKDLGDEIEDRLEKDALEINRTPKQMVVSFSTQLPDGRDTSSSRSYNFVPDDELCGKLLSIKALELLLESAEGVKPKDGENNRRLKAPIKFLGISVGKFEDHSEVKKTKRILDYFGVGTSKDVTVTDKYKDEVKLNDTNNISDKRPIKNNNGKEYILQKFFQVTDKSTEFKQNDDNPLSKPNNNPVLEASLDKQESFFAKILNGKSKKQIPAPNTSNSITSARPMTPVCDIIKCGDDSNDTEVSGSTIDMEINKSIALFEEDPDDVSRVSNIRQLLNSTKLMNENSNGTEPEELTVKTDQDNIEQATVYTEERFECPDCKKSISIKMFEEHADYHLALKLREEDRQIVRKEIKDRNNQKVVANKKEVTNNKIATNNQKVVISIPKVATSNELRSKEEQCNKNETVSSIANFFTKINENIPTEMCSECHKKVPLQKFAEHLDFHEAQKLNRELNKKTTILNGNSSTKRKRKSTSPVKKKKMPCKSIDSFFK